jgi:hypothetical protein
MTSRLRQLQIQWNELVPQAQARGLRGVREIALYPEGLHERIPHRQNRLNWLRRELGLTTTAFVTSSTGVVSGVDTDFTFGVEIEFLHPRLTRTQVCRALNDGGINCQDEGYTHRVSTHWKIVTDGSLGDYINGSEVVSPVLRDDNGFQQLTKVCEILSSLGCKVNKRCGLHVHVGARGETVDFFKSLVRLYMAAEPTVDSFMAPSRRGPHGGNGFCNSVRMVNRTMFDSATTVEQVATAVDQDNTPYAVRSMRRYRKLNLQSYWQHGTVEFRQHQGTVDAEKACNWVRFCLRLSLAARRGDTLTDATLETLLSIVGANETETRYFVSRRAFFDRAALSRAA